MSRQRFIATSYASQLRFLFHSRAMALLHYSNQLYFFFSLTYLGFNTYPYIHEPYRLRRLLLAVSLV